MFKRNFAQFVSGHKLWFIVSGIALVVVGAAAIRSFVRDKRARSEAESAFSVSCYFGRADFYCKDSPNKKKICNAKLAEMFAYSCAHLQAIGVEPESPVKIKIEAIDKCDKEEEKRSGCMNQAVLRDSAIDGVNGDIRLWHLDLDQKWTPSIVAHEMTHILSGKMYFRTSRIGDRFILGA